jgi:hypothetical protein
VSIFRLDVCMLKFELLKTDTRPDGLYLIEASVASKLDIDFYISMTIDLLCLSYCPPFCCLFLRSPYR